jgi:hypothetical protein
MSEQELFYIFFAVDKIKTFKLEFVLSLAQSVIMPQLATAEVRMVVDVLAFGNF